MFHAFLNISWGKRLLRQKSDVILNIYLCLIFVLNSLDCLLSSSGKKRLWQSIDDPFYMKRPHQRCTIQKPEATRCTRSRIPEPGYQILATTFWLPDPGHHVLAAYQILATRSWLPDPRYQILATRSWLPASGYQILATWSGIQDSEYHILVLFQPE